MKIYFRRRSILFIRAVVKLKICLIGHYKNNPDEGVKGISHNLHRELSKENFVLKCDVSDFPRSIKEIGHFDPEVIHIVVGPSTILSFFLSKTASFLFRDSIVVMSAPQPTEFRFEWMVRFLRPDMIFVQSSQSEGRFRRLGCKTKFLPAGIDTEKFVPADKNLKSMLRKKYGFDKSEFVILHVGHITKGRNLDILKSLTKLGKILIIGSTSTIVDYTVYEDLKNSGAIIKTQYIPEIQEIYALSDCYIFPTKSTLNSIETPLSILEAMACNLPVLTTRFGALPRLFEQGDGFIFIEKEESFIKAIKDIKNGIQVKTREKVLAYSWKNIAKRLMETYEELLYRTS